MQYLCSQEEIETPHCQLILQLRMSKIISRTNLCWTWHFVIKEIQTVTVIVPHMVINTRLLWLVSEFWIWQYFSILTGQNTTQVRLADGTNSSGRIEIFYKSQWSTLYGGSITQNNAVVFCRMLGFNDR